MFASGCHSDGAQCAAATASSSDCHSDGAQCAPATASQVVSSSSAQLSYASLDEHVDTKFGAMVREITLCHICGFNAEHCVCNHD